MEEKGGREEKRECSTNPAHQEKQQRCMPAILPGACVALEHSKCLAAGPALCLAATHQPLEVGNPKGHRVARLHFVILQVRCRSTAMSWQPDRAWCCTPVLAGQLHILPGHVPNMHASSEKEECRGWLASNVFIFSISQLPGWVAM